jgi:hypothetical protein
MRARRRPSPASLAQASNDTVWDGLDDIWLVTFMHYDLGFFDEETCRLEPAPSPFGAKVLPMSPV